MLATEWDMSDDGLTYTFTLREGVKFHDGTDLNADAVKFSLERGLTEASPRRGELAAVETIEAVDPTTVRVTLKEPYAPFLSVLTDRASMIVSPTAAQEAGEDFVSRPIGSGPFKFDSRETGNSITLVRNDDYWQEGLPKAERIVYKIFTDPNTAVVNLRSGQVDITDVVPSREVPALQGENFTVINEPGLGYQGIWLNTTAAPLDNQAVRQAISMLIDREALVKVIFAETAVPGNSPFTPAHFAHGESDTAPKPDVEGAKQLLADAGVSNVSFTLKTAPAAVNVQLAQLVKNFLQAGGITMEIEQLEFGTLLEQLDTGNYQAAQVGWSGRPDPDGNIYNFMTTGSSNNYAGYSNPTVDELLNTARGESDEAKRKEAYDQAMQILHDEAPYIYIYHQNNNFGMAGNITGFTYVPDGIIRTVGLNKQ
jgi:peptide/nickel transport system substrate-binding protein